MNQGVLRQLDVGRLEAGAVDQLHVGRPGLRPQLQVDPGTEAAAAQAEQQNGGDQGNEADPAGTGRSEFLVGTEPAEDQQGGGKQSHREGIDPQKREQQEDRLYDHAHTGPAIDQQGQHFAEKVAHQQYQGEYHHREQQRSQHLPHQVFM